jgi:hypothetical protein
MAPIGNLDGMTVNERLFATGLLPAWDAAVLSKDRTTMIELLKRVELASQADIIADSALKNKLDAPRQRQIELMELDN